MAYQQKTATPADLALEGVREGAVLVTANNRLARDLRQRNNASRLAAGEQVWTSPYISPWRAWTKALWEQHVYASPDAAPVLLTEEQETLLWERIISESPAAGDLISLTATAEAARESWTLLLAYRLTRAEIEPWGNEDTAAFLEWSDAFEGVCRDCGFLPAAHLEDTLEALLPSLDLPDRLFIAGFDEVAPQRAAFLKRLGQAGVEVSAVETARGVRGDCIRVDLPDRESEIIAAARWARTLLESGSTGRIGVVVHDLESRRLEVERVFRTALDPPAALPGAVANRCLVNVSAGARLTDYPVIRAALLALSLKPNEMEIGPLGALLRTRYLAGGESERTARAAVDAKLRRMGASRTSTRVVRRVCREVDSGCTTLRRALVRWERVRTSVPPEHSATGWARTFSLLLSRLGWPGDAPLSSAEYQVTEEWGDSAFYLRASGRHRRADVLFRGVHEAGADGRRRGVSAGVAAGAGPGPRDPGSGRFAFRSFVDYRHG